MEASSKQPSWQKRFKERMKPNTPDHIKDWYEKKGRIPLNLETATKSVGRVIIIPNRCKECDYCITYCPEDVLVFSEDLNDKGYHYPIVVEGKSCILCTFCSEICPDFAIFTEPVEEVTQ